ncbi:hypothetical protein NC653_003104 [Populus alba x Populus x berolinensis]|uniref:Uncharacterized protein n=1 Tax=Populus alba x Populus x berolinensis TaxID=444605 RepID=A0AAD6RQS2_9ROSI|nr:hypothetical protein NC653_003104 [Populus alba x Populus x berolinensis]
MLIFLCGLLLYLVDIWSFLLEMSCLKGSISLAHCLYFKIGIFEEFIFFIDLFVVSFFILF